jgi:hypothetical protein
VSRLTKIRSERERRGARLVVINRRLHVGHELQSRVEANEIEGSRSLSAPSLLKSRYSSSPPAHPRTPAPHRHVRRRLGSRSRHGEKEVTRAVKCEPGIKGTWRTVDPRCLRPPELLECAPGVTDLAVASPRLLQRPLKRPFATLRDPSRPFATLRPAELLFTRGASRPRFSPNFADQFHCQVPMAFIGVAFIDMSSHATIKARSL